MTTAAEKTNVMSPGPFVLMGELWLSCDTLLLNVSVVKMCLSILKTVNFVQMWQLHISFAAAACDDSEGYTAARYVTDNTE